MLSCIIHWLCCESNTLNNLRVIKVGTMIRRQNQHIEASIAALQTIISASDFAFLHQVFILLLNHHKRTKGFKRRNNYLQYSIDSHGVQLS